MAAIIENFDSYSNGAEVSTSGSWYGTTGVFQVVNSTFQSSPNSAKLLVGASGNRGVFQDIAATFTGKQLFWVKGVAVVGSGNEIEISFHKGAVTPTDPNTGRLAWASVYNNGSGLDLRLNCFGGGTATALASISTSTWYLVTVEWDSTRGTNGQFRMKVDSGSFTSWLEAATSFTATGVLAIGMQNNADPNSEVYFDTLTDSGSSASPSKSPSISPSASPSLSPSLSPSTSPSISPSISPSASLSPSLSPSVSPSASISPSASQSPSGSPSLSPSISPSISPSLSPSVSPSSSISPSLSPSVSPSASLSPSLSPSKSPSFSPSVSPSASLSPSRSPSLSPSPSISPSPSPQAWTYQGGIVDGPWTYEDGNLETD